MLCKVMNISQFNKTSLQNLLSSVDKTLIQSKDQILEVQKTSTEIRSIVTSANLNQPEFLALNQNHFMSSLRNRIFLKYLGIDYELNNTKDIYYND
jgi:hypothetical protein